MQRTVSAPAKVNLILDVLGRRPDGYHDVAMLMVRLSLHDRVTVSLTPGSDIAVSCPGLALAAGEENIAGRAARLFLTCFTLSGPQGRCIRRQTTFQSGSHLIQSDRFLESGPILRDWRACLIGQPEAPRITTPPVLPLTHENRGRLTGPWYPNARSFR